MKDKFSHTGPILLFSQFPSKHSLVDMTSFSEISRYIVKNAPRKNTEDAEIFLNLNMSRFSQIGNHVHHSVLDSSKQALLKVLKVIFYSAAE